MQSNNFININLQNLDENNSISQIWAIRNSFKAICAKYKGSGRGYRKVFLNSFIKIQSCSDQLSSEFPEILVE